MVEHRSEPRAAVMVRVEASWKDESGVAHTAAATLEDKSRGGVALRLSESVPVGSRLDIKSPREQFSGTVLHCHRTNKGFLLGLRRNPAELPHPQ